MRVSTHLLPDASEVAWLLGALSLKTQAFTQPTDRLQAKLKIIIPAVMVVPDLVLEVHKT